MTEMAPSTRKRRVTNDRITIDALRFYVPFFHAADQAEKQLLEGGLPPAVRNTLETQARLKDLTVRKIASLSGPLITSEINKMIAGSHLPHSDDLFDLLYYAGLSGLVRGLRHFDEGKMKASATNYLFQWFTVYAKRELSIVEAPFGVAPSRFQKFKKIAAVRKKLSAERGHPVSNSELFDYFQSGAADVKNMYGRVGSSDKASEANKAITLDLIQEQEKFEMNFLNVQLLDPLEDYSFDARFSREDKEIFSETVFGVFADQYHVLPKAVVVLQSELNSSQISEGAAALVASMPQKEYQEFAGAWKELLRDFSSPFYDFLRTVPAEDFKQFDIANMLKQADNSQIKGQPIRYQLLFTHSKGK